MVDASPYRSRANGHSARSLLENGHRVMVWNRTSAKVEPLVREGAVLTPGTACAVGTSPIVIVGVADDTVTYRLPDTTGRAAVPDGKVLVQLSTGTPQEVRDAEAWAHARSNDDLDGAILAPPSQTGRPDTPIFQSGSKAAFRKSEPAPNRLAGNLIYTGEAVGSASAWDLATPSCMIGAKFGGARIGESEGLRAGSFGAMIADIAPVPRRDDQTRRRRQ